MKRFLARLLYRNGPACYACLRPGPQPCEGHEYGGVIRVSWKRRWAPWWIARHVDSRAGW